MAINLSYQTVKISSIELILSEEGGYDKRSVRS